MPVLAHQQPRAITTERTWLRFLLVISVFVAVSLGVAVIALPGGAAPAGKSAQPLKFDPPPVDLDFNSQGADADAQSTRQAQPAQRPQARAASVPAPVAASADENVVQELVQAESEPEGGGAAAGEGQSGKPIRLFGTVEFRSALKNLPKWDRVLNSEKRQPTFGPDTSRMPANVADRWVKLAADLKDKPVMEQIQKVNNFFNQWPYKTDMVVWGVEDFWATPAEFMKKSGDCEDYAISKYYALRSLGIPADKLRIVVVIDSIRRLGHAVLVVYVGDTGYVLDNLTNLVLSHQRLTQYVPQYSVNEEFWWRHIRPVNKPKN